MQDITSLHASLELLMSRSERPRWWVLVLIAVVAGCYRLFLALIYFGWEESDYGNLAMARGVLDSGFTEFDMRHLPLYYFLSALVLSLVGDTVIATHLVSLAAGVSATVLAYLIGRRVFDEWTAAITALLLCFQPEFALYSSSSLREPLFTCLVLLGCHLLLSGQPRGAVIATGFSFLTRFDSLATNFPAILSHLVRRRPRVLSARHPVWTALLLFSLFVTGWSIYCGQVHGTYLFFMPTVEVNLETGGARELPDRLEFARQGLSIMAALFFGTLPRHLGPVVWGLSLVGFVAHRREILGKTARGTAFVYLALNTLFWLGIGFVGQHEPEHNLYWKWMYTLTPFWVLFSAAGTMHILRHTQRYKPLTVAATLGIFASTAWSFSSQTRFQLEQSDRLYRPQVELAQWVEANVPPHTTLIFDNIPACYLNRKPHEWRLISWFDLEVDKGSPEAFARYLLGKDIRYVLWFKEDWTQAPAVAPFLASVQPHDLGLAKLVPLAHEDQYGFIFYQVVPSAGAGP